MFSNVGANGKVTSSTPGAFKSVQIGQTILLNNTGVGQGGATEGKGLRRAERHQGRRGGAELQLEAAVLLHAGAVQLRRLGLRQQRWRQQQEYYSEPQRRCASIPCCVR